jgi:hypothetical protein
MARSRKAAPGPAARRATFAGEALYLVRRLYEDHWDSILGNSTVAYGPRQPDWGGPVKAFTARARAEALCEKLRRELLDGVSPFAIHGDRLADLTSLPPGPFRDWLIDAGLSPPPAGKNALADWRRWWEKNRRGLTADQRHHVFAGLDKLRPYAVAELDPPAAPGRAKRGESLITVFTVEVREWKDDDDFLASLYEEGGTLIPSFGPFFAPSGGLRLATFRDRDRAEAYRQELWQHVPRECRAFSRGGLAVAEHTIEVEEG